MRTGSRYKVRICPVRALVGRNRVDAFDETQVFIEVQIQAKKISRTNSGILFPGELSPSPLVLRLFQINFAHLFASDIFCDCNLSSLLSLNILGDEHSTHKFWNMFLRNISRFGNMFGKRWLKRKPRSKMIIIAQLVVVQIHAIREVKEEAYLENLRALRHALSRDRKVEEDEEEYSRAVLETMNLVIFSTEDNNCCSSCSICLDDFKQGANILELYCEHMFHRDCIIRWINTNLFISCPVCRDDTGHKCYC